MTEPPDEPTFPCGVQIGGGIPGVRATAAPTDAFILRIGSGA